MSNDLITVGTDRLSLPSFRSSPWHALGRRVERSVGAADALALAGLDWRVERKPLYTSDLNAVPNHVAITRSDTGAVLGVVGTGFEPVENAELFAFLQSLGGAAPITYDSAGCFRGGAVVWVLARITDLDIRLGDDLSEGFMLVTTAHDGSRAVTISPTMRRISCMNSLRMVDAQMRRAAGKPRLQAGFRLRHTRHVRRAIEEIAAAYAHTREAHRATEDAYEYLSAQPMSEAMVRAMFERCFATEAASEVDRAKAIREAREHKLRAILASPTSQVPGTSGSAFSLLQAVVEFIDHERPTRTTKGEASSLKRFESAQLGHGAFLKGRAFDVILDLTAAR